MATAQDVPVDGTLGVSSSGGGALTFEVVAQGTKGTAVVTDAATGAFTYTPEAGQTGGDSFTFRVSEAGAWSNVATVTVTISAPPGSLPPSGPVPASAETQVFASGGDADDPAIWVDPDDGSRSVVIGSNKDDAVGGLAVYDLEGNELQYVQAGKLNNVSVRSGVFGGQVLVVASNRTDNALSFFHLDPATRTLSAAGQAPVGFEPYGTCLYVSPVDGDVYAFVTENASTAAEFDQYRLTSTGSDVAGVKVRDMSTSTLAEGCVADDAAQQVFLAEEALGLFRYAAEPTEDDARTTVALVSTGDLVADVEGVAIAYDGAGGPAYLVVSSQGDSTFQVYDLEGPHAHRKEFSVVDSGPVDGATDSDGVAVTRADLGPRYPNGLVVVQDGDNAGASVTNFKYVDAATVFGPTGGS